MGTRGAVHRDAIAAVARARMRSRQRRGGHESGANAAASPAAACHTRRSSRDTTRRSAQGRRRAACAARSRSPRAADRSTRRSPARRRAASARSRDRRAAEQALERRDERLELDRLVVADVVDRVRRAAGRARAAAREHAHDAFDDVVDVREVAPHPPVVEHVDRLAREDRLREQHRRHVGAPPRPVDGEEAQPGRRQREQVAVAVRHQLVRLLRRRVQAHRMVDALVLGERQRVVGAVDARARRVDEMRDARVAAAFEHVAERDEVVRADTPRD